ncbi:hypothetical protein JCM8097_003736 [Rhodosporidiobolus ruineniae]
MGALADLLRRRDSPPKHRPPNSTLDLALPLPQPLNVYSDSATTASSRTRTRSMDEVARGMARIDLARGGGGETTSGPSTPSRPAQGGGARRSPERAHVYPPFPPKYSSPPLPPRPAPQAPPPASPHSSPSRSPLRPPLPTPPALPPRPPLPHASSAPPLSPFRRSPTRPAQAYGYHSSPPGLPGRVKMPEPQHYASAPCASFPSSSLPAASPFHSPPLPPPPPYAPLSYAHGAAVPPTYPPPPSPPRPPLPPLPASSPFSAPSATSTARPRPYAATPTTPARTGPMRRVVPSAGSPSPASPSGATNTKTPPSRRLAAAGASPASVASSSASGSVYAAAASTISLSSDEDDLPEPSTLFSSRSPSSAARRPPPSASTKKGSEGARGKARCVSSPAAPPSHLHSRLRASSSSSLSSSPSPHRSPSRKASPAKPIREPGPGQVRCAGITGAGTRCVRVVDLPSYLSRAGSPEDGDDGSGAGEEAGEGGEGQYGYCHQHVKLAVVESRCLVARRVIDADGREERREEWVAYADWIPADLPLSTQAQLRGIMNERVSAKDKEGYIYLHELVPRPSSSSSPSSPSPSSHAGQQPTTLLKLGRALRPIQRLSQWRSSCPSREPLVRAVYPLPSSASSSSAPVLAMRGVEMRFAERGTRNHHRWERLCLVELAGREAAFLSSSSFGKGEGGGEGRREREVCACGTRHQECFLLPSSAVAGGGEGGEAGWAVREVVERWERWCRDILG